MAGNVWEAGDFGRIAPGALSVGEFLCDEVPVYAGQAVLDIGCGTGNTALAAARRRAVAAGADPVEMLLERARERSRFEGLEVEWRLGGAESLPWDDASFDVALSSFGLIFCEEPRKAVAEASRVLRPGGSLAMTSWPLGCMNDELFRICSEVKPELKAIRVARDWGRENFAVESLAAGFAAIRILRRSFLPRANSVDQWLAGMKQFLAPVVLAYQGLDAAASLELDDRLKRLGSAHNAAPEHGYFARIPYLEIHCRKA